MRRRQLLAGLGGSLALAGCQRVGPIGIGFLGPLSGRRADLGEGGRNGALLAVEDANAAGGVAGRPLQLRVEDDQLDPALARTGFKRLQDQGIVALVGAYTKPVGEAVAPLAAAAGIPVVSPNLAIPTPHGGGLFRLNRTSQQNAQAYARQLTQQGQRRITVVSELSSEEFVLSWLGHFQSALVPFGAQLGHQVRYISDPDTRFGALAEQALSAPCDGTLLIAPTVDVARLCQHLQRRRPGLPMATIDRNGNEQLLQWGGRAVEGVVMLQSFDPDARDTGFRAFAERYHARFRERPGQNAVMAHDAVALLHQALLRRGGSRVPLEQTLMQQGPYQGLQQTMAFDAQGVAARQAWFVAVRGGRFVTTGPA
jgi:branched-chain amino acid transport system substrate-binding protein